MAETLIYPHKLREDVIDGLGPWYWPFEDSGAWDGPVDDWTRSHRRIIETLPVRQTVVQAGGNCGLYPALLSQMFNAVFTFEPDAENFFFLQKNNMQFQNVVSYMDALGDVEQVVGMRQLSRQNVGMHVVDENGHGVMMRRLDDFEFANVDLIWYDLEGYEYFALLGSVETIKRYLPMVGVERANGDVTELLTSLGYVKYATSMMDTFFVHTSKLGEMK